MGTPVSTTVPPPASCFFEGPFNNELYMTLFVWMPPSTKSSDRDKDAAIQATRQQKKDRDTVTHCSKAARIQATSCADRHRAHSENMWQTALVLMRKLQPCPPHDHMIHKEFWTASVKMKVLGRQRFTDNFRLEWSFVTLATRSLPYLVAHSRKTLSRSPRLSCRSDVEVGSILPDSRARLERPKCTSIS